MRRYKLRTPLQASLVGPEDNLPLTPATLFGRTAPLRLEIGAGHGEFVAQMAAAHPEEDFVVNEIDRLRVTKIAHKCTKAGIANVRVFAGTAEAFLPRLDTGIFSRIYVLFPDPWPKPGHRRRRLLRLAVLRELTRVAAPGCRFVFSSDTHDYACQVLNNLTMLPGCWRNLLAPSGYAFDRIQRFPTLFERHKRDEGCHIMNLHVERTKVPCPT